MGGGSIESKMAYLEKYFRVTYNIEEPPPPCHLRLPCTSNNNVQRNIKVIQKLDDVGQEAVAGATGSIASVLVIASVTQRRIRLDDRVQQNL